MSSQLNIRNPKGYKMTKTKLYTEVVEILNQHKVDTQSELYKEIVELVKPKSGGGVAQHPMKTVDDINYHYCRYTEFYLPEDEMVMSNGKSKGYSKKAIAKWTKTGKTVQSINEAAMKLLLDGDTENGTIKANEAEELKQLRNKPEYYDDVRSEYEDIKLEIE